MTFKEQWTLENVYPNGVEGDAFLLTVSSIRKHIEDHVQVVQNLPSIHGNESSWHAAVVQHFECQQRLSTPGAFAGAWTAVRAQDPEPATAQKTVMLLWNSLKSLGHHISRLRRSG